MSWRGGQELALHHSDLAIAHLLTSVNAHYERVSMHGMRLAQAVRIGLPLKYK